MEHSSQIIALEVLESLNDGIQVIGFDWTYLYVNAALEAHGQRSREELLGRSMMECYPGIEQTEMFALLSRCMHERTAGEMENQFSFPDGSSGWFELKFIPVPMGVCALSLDITARKRSAARLARTEAQLVQAQKMEAIGRLAGGVAHDFNNLLSVILSYADLLTLTIPPGEPTLEDVNEIRKAGLRATDLTQQLLTFSRQRVMEPSVLNLNAVVSDAARMFGRLLGEDIELSCMLTAHPCHVMADPGTLDQVLMNLAVNARDAMPRGGKLTLETKQVSLDADYCSSHLGVEPGSYVMLAITDTGLGISKEHQARIFDPFFTTKAQGKGTGLGLSMVFGIVKQCGGHIWLYSELGVGTTFKIYLPLIQGSFEERPISSSSTIPRGNETILLVEDDAQVRAVACTILTRAGYRVLQANDGVDAVEIWQRQPTGIHLLLTDVVLPQMSGQDLAAKLSAEQPELKVLFMSGYTDDTVSLHGILDSGAAYLQKPLTPALLSNKVRAVLGAPRAAK